MKNVSCPVYDISCPYFKAGMWTMPEQDGTHPLKECDDYGFALEDMADEEDVEDNYTLADLGYNWW